MTHPFLAARNWMLSPAKSFLRNGVASSLKLAVFSAVLVATLSAARADATTYYVSPNGNNTTGLSFATAWTELNQINWKVIQNNDSIQIDGGTSSYTYHTATTVPSTIQLVNFYQSGQAGHNGTVILDGAGSPNSCAIYVSGGANIRGQVTQKQTTGFQVKNYPVSGIIFDNQNVGSAGASVDGLTFISDGIGINVLNWSNSTSGRPSFNSCIFQDCSQSGVANSSTTTQVNLFYDWFHNTKNPAGGTTGAGVVGSADLQSCVLGPLLKYGVYSPSTQASNFYIEDALFLDALQANIGAPGELGSCIVIGATSYAASKNELGQAHSNIIDFIPNSGGASTFTSSVFYGAQVKVPAGSVLYFDPNNLQYDVTGNTTALAPTQIDPKFKSSAIYTFPYNVSATTLINTDFSCASTPTIGATTTSVAKLLKLQN